MKKLDMQKIEEAMKKIILSVDKSARLEAVIMEEDEIRVIVAKGTQSDRATFSEDLLDDYLNRDQRGQDVRKAIGKVISKLNRMSQRRG